MHSPTFYREGRTIRVGGTEYKVQTAQAGGEFVSASGDVRQLKPFAGSRGDAWELVAQPVHDSGTLNLTNLPLNSLHGYQRMYTHALSSPISYPHTDGEDEMTENTVGDGGDEGDGEGGGSGTQQDLHLPPTHSHGRLRMHSHDSYPPLRTSGDDESMASVAAQSEDRSGNASQTHLDSLTPPQYLQSH